MVRRIVLVIGLLAIVAGLWGLFSAWTTFHVNARNSRFNEDIDNLFAALQEFKEHVGTYPIGSNAEVVKALKGKNPKNVIVLVGRKFQLNDKGELLDPWRTPLRIYFSDNGVLIRSAGPNRRFDDSTALNGDDFFRSN